MFCSSSSSSSPLSLSHSQVSLLIMEDVQPGRSLHSAFPQSSFLFSTNEREETRSIFGICTYRFLLSTACAHFKAISWWCSSIFRSSNSFKCIAKKKICVRYSGTTDSSLSLSLSGWTVVWLDLPASWNLLHVAPADKHALPQTFNRMLFFFSSSSSSRLSRQISLATRDFLLLRRRLFQRKTKHFPLFAFLFFYTKCWIDFLRLCASFRFVSAWAFSFSTFQFSFSSFFKGPFYRCFPHSYIFVCVCVCLASSFL